MPTELHYTTRIDIDTGEILTWQDTTGNRNEHIKYGLNKPFIYYEQRNQNEQRTEGNRHYHIRKFRKHTTD